MNWKLILSLQILPEAEKDRYERIAKEYKAKMRGAEGDKYKLDNAGHLLSVRFWQVLF